MLDQGRLQWSIEQAIRPHTNETDPLSEQELPKEEDPFVIEVASFLTRELVDLDVTITEDQALLDDEELQNLPVAQVLGPHIEQLISSPKPLSTVARIIQIYTAPDPDPETQRHTRFGPCQVALPRFPLSFRVDWAEQLCDRSVRLTFHHLIPRSTHRTMLKRHIFTKDEMLSRGASLCGSCHGAIHSMFDNKTLALELNTIDKLLAQEKVRRFCEWNSKQRIGSQ